MRRRKRNVSDTINHSRHITTYYIVLWMQIYLFLSISNAIRSTLLSLIRCIKELQAEVGGFWVNTRTFPFKFFNILSLPRYPFCDLSEPQSIFIHSDLVFCLLQKGFFYFLSKEIYNKNTISVV